MTIDSNMKPVKITATDQDILTVLLGRELHGLAILEHLNSGRPVKRIMCNVFYRILDRLEEKGLIVSRWGNRGDHPTGGQRKYCRVTELGELSLSAVQEYRLALAQRTSTP